MSNEVVGQTLPPENEVPALTINNVAAQQSSDDAVIIIRTTTLVVLLGLSLIGNSLVVLSVAQSRSSRYTPFNTFVLSMASFCLLECAFTMSLATGFSVEKQWNFGNFMAGFNSAFIQLQNVGVLLTIAVMAIDRYIAVTKLTKYHSQASKHKANYVALYTWIHALLFSLPLFFQNQTIGITCRAFAERCLCGLVEGTSLVFTSLLVALCFVLPLFIIILFLILVRRKAYKERKQIKSINTGTSFFRLQESLVLKEAGWCKYIIMLIVLYLFFKMPYIIVDIMTQQNFTLVFEPAANASGSRFYYQTAFSWMMFSFSAIFPVLTFIQFPDHWRKMKSYVTCAPTTTSAANGGPLTRSQRQRQRRLRQRERIAIRNARKKKQASVTNSTVLSDKKAPSTISTDVTGEKITVPAAGELLFRVPVLYAATDGLHLVASNKMLTTKEEARKSKASTSSNKRDERDANFAGAASTSHISQPSSDVIGEFRPSSVVDKRVDVTGSRDNLDDDIAYINAAHLNYDFDPDDSDSELNESINSRTLICPNHRSRTVASAASVKVKDWPTKSVWKDPIAENSWGYEEFGGSNAVSRTDAPYIEDEDEPPHPHTPSPPPDDNVFRVSSPASLRLEDTSIDEHLMEKIKVFKLRLPAIASRGVPVAFKSVESRQKPLISQTENRNHDVDNPSDRHNSSSRRGSTMASTIKQNVALAANRVFPNQTKAFHNEDDTKSHVINSGRDTASDIDQAESRSEIKTSHRIIKVASRKETRNVAQHIGHYARPSHLPVVTPETR